MLQKIRHRALRSMGIKTRISTSLQSAGLPKGGTDLFEEKSYERIWHYIHNHLSEKLSNNVQYRNLIKAILDHDDNCIPPSRICHSTLLALSNDLSSLIKQARRIYAQGLKNYDAIRLKTGSLPS